VLAIRHAITGDSDFPPSSLATQLAVPGARVWIARADDGGASDDGNAAVGIVVAYRDDDHGWYHLGAASDDGYRRGAMYALFARMLTDLAAEGVRVLDLGAGAGADDASAGLERFKRGWATRTLATHLVGVVLDPEGSGRALARASGATPGWFPPYRGGRR
jgi:hypothetical protein